MDELIVQVVAQVYNVTVNQIKSDSRKGCLPEAKRMVIFISNRVNLPLGRAAKNLNLSRTHVYRSVDKSATEQALYKEVYFKYLQCLELLETNLNTVYQESYNMLQALKNNN